MEKHRIILLRGQAKYIFIWLHLVATSQPYETDLTWWQTRLWLRRN
jgi:hypothetical protein